MKNNNSITNVRFFWFNGYSAFLDIVTENGQTFKGFCSAETLKDAFQGAYSNARMGVYLNRKIKEYEN